MRSIRCSVITKYWRMPLTRETTLHIWLTSSSIKFDANLLISGLLFLYKKSFSIYLCHWGFFCSDEFPWLETTFPQCQEKRRQFFMPGKEWFINNCVNERVASKWFPPLIYKLRHLSVLSKSSFCKIFSNELWDFAVTPGFGVISSPLGWQMSCCLWNKDIRNRMNLFYFTHCFNSPLN